MAIQKQHFRVLVKNQEAVHVIHMRNDSIKNKQPAVIFVHGTLGYGGGGRRWRIRLGEILAKEGYEFFLFDHRGCGYSDGEFENMTVSQRVDDLQAVISFAEKLETVDNTKVALWGLSLGSAVSVLSYSKVSSVHTMILYTLPCDMSQNYPAWFRSFMKPEEYEKLTTQGRGYMHPAREFITQDFTKDLINHNTITAVSGIDIPLLLIQPKSDEQVPTTISEKCFRHATHLNSRIEYIEGRHTFEGNEDQEKEVVRITCDWLGSLKNKS